MLQFVWKLVKAAAADALRRMGTTALAVGVGLAPWVALRVQDFSAGSVQAAIEDWSNGLFWTIGVWLVLLGYYLHLHFRPLLREHRRVFHMVAFSQDQVSDPDRIAIWCSLRFCKDIGPVDLTVRVRTLLAHGPTSHVVHTEKLGKVLRDEGKRLGLGSLRVAKPHRPAYHSIWGNEPGTENLKKGQVPILTDSKNLIEISVESQTYRCYVEFVTPPPGALSAAMYLTDEDRSPWILEL